MTVVKGVANVVAGLVCAVLCIGLLVVVAFGVGWLNQAIVGPCATGPHAQPAWCQNESNGP